jgi:hypothetical protein
MGAYVVDYDASLPVSRDLAVTARAVLAAYKFSAYLVPQIDQWVAEWKLIFLEEVDNEAERVSANALAFSLDADLNDLTDEASNLLQKLTKNDRTDPQWILDFSTERVGDFKRPVLGKQLERMRIWPSTMLPSPDQAPVDLGTRVAAKVTECDAVLATLSAVEQKIRTFRLTGKRRKLLDDFNALRKSIEAEVQQLPLKQPGLKLPTNFLSRVLPPERPAANPPTAAELKVKLDALKEAVAKLDADYAAAVKAEADVAEADAKLQANAAQKKIDEMEAEIAKQQAELAKLKAKQTSPADPSKPPTDPTKPTG